MKSLIVGGAGLIGSKIVEKLCNNYEVIIFDKFAQYTDPTIQGYVEHRGQRFEQIREKIHLERGNCADHFQVLNILQQYKPDYVIHLAAVPLAKMKNATTDEMEEGTIKSTRILLESINFLQEKGELNIKKFIYTSSSMVYGNFLSESVTEEHPKNPISLYGIMKSAGEEVALGLGRLYKIPTTIVIPSAVYGPTDMNRRVAQIFLENAMSGKEIVVNGKDEKQDFTYIDDIADGFILAMEKDESIGEKFNMTYGQARTLFELATIIQSHYPKTQIVIKERDKSSPFRGTLCIDKAKRLLGYSPKFSLEEGIADYIKKVGGKR